ncbi:MAG: cobalt-precorrin-5B (C(1))-methyltransferase, partial [Methanosarcinales archaeon]|nr:cobalt-precorrin-5B (C(1))-methyltransferase [Methanosarcinales archaeon]
QGHDGWCRAVKDGGDHQFDITHGLEIEARARAAPETGMVPGPGIGVVARGGLCAARGKPAISRSAREQIREAMEEGLKEAGLEGAVVELCIPRGLEAARQTLNPRVGVHEGLSVLGSTGFVEPWNEHMGQDVAQGLVDAERVVATTGRVGLRFSRILFPRHQAVLVGSHLDRLHFRAEQDSVLCGLPGLILKWALPEVLEGTGYATVAEMAEREPDHPALARALERAKRALPHTRIVLINRDGSIFMEA